MTVKSLKKQLVAAIAMVLVATLALGTATFAWFANNNKVEAKGMSITAQSEGANLEIAWGSATQGSTDFVAGKTTITTDAATKELYPTHYVVEGEKYIGVNDIAATDWVHTFSNKYDTAVVDGYSFGETVLKKVVPYTSLTSPASTDYALIVPIKIQLNAQSTGAVNNIKATATITQKNATDGKGMTTAGRVGYIVNDAVVDAGLKTGIKSAKLCDIATAATPVTIYAIIYFDGDDVSCTSEKFDSDEYTVDIVFEGEIANP